MGKQSARLYYSGNDHKDIYFKKHYHAKMYKGSQLVWEKLFPNEYFILFENNSEGILVLDKTEKYAVVIPCAGCRVISVAGYIGKTIFGCSYEIISELQEKKYDIIYSADSINWKRINLEIGLDGLYNLEMRIKADDNSFLILDRSDKYYYTIVKFDSDGNFDKSIKTEYGFDSWACADGYGRYYVFYNKEYTDIVDSDGNLVYSYSDDISKSEDTRLKGCTIKGAWRAGSSVYGVANEIYDTNPRIIKLNKTTGKYSLVKYITDEDKRLYGFSVIYKDMQKTVVLFQYKNARGHAVSVEIFTFSESGFISSNEFDGCVKVMEAKTGEYYNVWISHHTYIDDNEKYHVVMTLNVANPSNLYISNNLPVASATNGICLWGTAIDRDSGDEKIAVVYFDNLYFKESDGNFLIITDMDY